MITELGSRTGVGHVEPLAITFFGQKFADAVHRSSGTAKSMQRQDDLRLERRQWHVVGQSFEFITASVETARGSALVSLVEKPVVAYDNGGVSEMIVEGGTGFMLSPGDVDGLANRIMQLAGDGDLRQKLGVAAGEKAQRELLLNRHIDSMERILKAAADHHQRAQGGVR